MTSTPPKPAPHWRREVERSDQGRMWAGVTIGAVIAFLIMELPAVRDRIPFNTASEWVWSIAPPFGFWWFVLMPPFAGLCAWLVPHLSLRWGGPWELLWCVLAAYAVAVVIVLLLRG